MENTVNLDLFAGRGVVKCKANNNAKMFVPGTGKTIRSWCSENNYPYTMVYQAIGRGLSFKEIKGLCEERYKFDFDSNIKELIHVFKIGYQKHQDKRSNIKHEFFNLKKLSDQDKERYWSQIISGCSDTEIEIWKEVPDTQPKLEVSSLGRFRSVYANGTYRLKKLFLKPRYRKNGEKRDSYLAITYSLTSGRKIHCSASITIARAFVPNPDNHPFTSFIDGNSNNLNINNIKWISAKEHGETTGYSIKVSFKILQRLPNGSTRIYPSARSCAKELGCSYQTVLDICNGVTKKCMFDLSFITNKEYIRQRSKNYSGKTAFSNNKTSASGGVINGNI